MMMNYVACMVCLVGFGGLVVCLSLLRRLSKKYVSLSNEFQTLSREFESFQDYAYAKLDKTECLLKDTTDKLHAIEQEAADKKRDEAMTQLNTYIDEQDFVLTSVERDLFVQNMESLEFYNASNKDELIACCYKQYLVEVVAFREEQERIKLNGILEKLTNAEVKAVLAILNKNLETAEEVKPYINDEIHSVLAEAAKTF